MDICAKRDRDRALLAVITHCRRRARAARKQGDADTANYYYNWISQFVTILRHY